MPDLHQSASVPDDQQVGGAGLGHKSRAGRPADHLLLHSDRGRGALMGYRGGNHISELPLRLSLECADRGRRLVG
jgi:hypothetical protein